MDGRLEIVAEILGSFNGCDDIVIEFNQYMSKMSVSIQDKAPVWISYDFCDEYTKAAQEKKEEMWHLLLKSLVDKVWPL